MVGLDVGLPPGFEGKSPPPRFCANEPHSGLPKGVLLHWFSRQHAHETQSQPPPLLLPPPSLLQARPCNEPQARSSPRCSNSVRGHSCRPRQTPLPHSPPPLPFSPVSSLQQPHSKKKAVLRSIISCGLAAFSVRSFACRYSALVTSPPSPLPLLGFCVSNQRYRPRQPAAFALPAPRQPSHIIAHRTPLPLRVYRPTAYYPRPYYENFTPRPAPAMSPSSKIHFHNTLSLFPYATTLAARVTMWA